MSLDLCCPIDSGRFLDGLGLNLLVWHSALSDVGHSPFDDSFLLLGGFFWSCHFRLLPC